MTTPCDPDTCPSHDSIQELVSNIPTLLTNMNFSKGVWAALSLGLIAFATLLVSITVYFHSDMKEQQEKFIHEVKEQQAKHEELIEKQMKYMIEERRIFRRELLRDLRSYNLIKRGDYNETYGITDSDIDGIIN